jgi:hypothetical protein
VGGRGDDKVSSQGFLFEINELVTGEVVTSVHKHLVAPDDSAMLVDDCTAKSRLSPTVSSKFKAAVMCFDADA